MTSRPVLNIPRSTLDTAIDIAALAGILLTIILLITKWAALPDVIPIHFDISGKPDSTGSKLTILLFPAIGILIYAMLTVLNRFPHTFNYPVPITEANAYRQYQIAVGLIRWLKLELVWEFAFIEWQIILAASGKALGLNVAFLLIILLVVFGTVGYYLWQAYQNR